MLTPVTHLRQQGNHDESWGWRWS